MSLPTGTIGVVLSDVAGSTRLWEDHRQAMPAVMARLDEVVNAAVAARDGVRPAEQGEGDSFVVAFARVSDAIAFALDVQLATREEPWPEEIALRVRMAVHAGEVALRDEANYLGSTMNRAGRLRALAAGGQTLVSGAASDLADNRLPDGAALVDLGTHRLRDLERPERVFELTHPGIAEDFPPLRSLDVVPNNLPAQLTSFIGRTDELAQVAKLLGEHRLVTVTGPGGAGKTRLALHAAAEASGRFGDGVWFVDLSEITDPDLVPQAIADATGAVESAGRTGLDAVGAHLAPKRSLVVLDNCEHVVAAAATAADRLLRACADLSVLATSREPIGVDGEITWRIPTLSLPDDDDSGPGLVASDAVRLFIDRAVATRPNFTVTNDNAPAVVQICQRLEGIPLAIELAAARIRVLSPAQIAAGLDDRFRLLGASPRTALPRQATLAASVDWSVDLLDDAERCLLARLSVFAGSFDLDAAEAICADAPLCAARILDLLDALVQKSLVVAEEHPTTSRYRLLETIRQYARARLATDESNSLRLAHARHFAEVAWRSHTDYDAVVGGVLARLEADASNLRAALEHSVESTDAATALRLASSLLGYWANRGLISEGTRWLGAVLELEGGDAGRARAHWGVGWLAAYTGDVEAQLARASEALSLAEEAGDDATAALAVATMTSAMSWLDPDAATPLHERVEALIAGGADRDVFVVVHTSFLRGAAYAYAGDFRRARELLARAVEIQSRSGAFAEIGPKAVAAFCAAHEGEIANALRDGRDAVEAARSAGSIFWLSMGLLHLAAIAGIAGEHREARTALAEASEVAATMTNETPRAYIDGLGAAKRVLLGESPGVDQVMSAVERLEGFGLHRWSAPARAAAAEMHAGSGDMAAAKREVDLALTYADGKPLWNLPVLMLLASRVQRRTGDRVDAEATAHDGLTRAVSSGARAYIPPLLDQIAGLAVEAREEDEAVRLFAASDAARRAMKTGSWPLLEPQRLTDIATARENLGDELFAQAWAEGGALDLDAAIAYARRGRGKRKRPTVGWGSLTPVERDVVGLVAEGLTNDGIAEKLFISRNTVRTHLRNVFAKLGVASRTELAALAHRRGAM